MSEKEYAVKNAELESIAEYRLRTIDRLEAANADLQRRVDAVEGLREALLNLVRQFAEDDQEPSSEDLEFMLAIGHARTALTAYAQAQDK